MWPRAVEFMLGLWLLLSPFIFRHAPGAYALWATDLVCAAAILTLSSLSCWKKLRRAHLLELVVAAWLVLFAYFHGGSPAAPGYQNEILVGLVLLLFAIIPTEANQPPVAWREHYARRARQRGM